MPKLGLGTGFSRSGLVTPGVVTDGLVMKHMYSAGAVQKLSDGAASFNGTSDYIAIGAKPVDTADATYTFWHNSNFIGSHNRAIFGHGGDAIGEFSLQYNSAGKALLYLKNDLYQYWDDGAGNSHVSDGKWHHVAVVVDIDSMPDCKLYIDGVEIPQSSRATNGSATAYGNMEIGRASSTTEFEGYLCNFGVWTGALTQPQIKSIMWKQYADLTTSEKTNLVSFWNLDNNLTTQGSSSWVADEADTTFGSNVTPTWTSSNGAVIDGQTITLGSSGVVSALATISPVGVYKVNVTVTGYTGSGNIEMPWDGSGSSNMQISANGTYEFYEKSSDTGWLIYAADGRGATITINSITKANGNIGELL